MGPGAPQVPSLLVWLLCGPSPLPHQLFLAWLSFGNAVIVIAIGLRNRTGAGAWPGPLFAVPFYMLDAIG